MTNTIPTHSHIGKQLRAVRKRAGLSQTELARRMTAHGLEYGNSSISLSESGVRRLSLRAAVLIAQILDCTLIELTDVGEGSAEAQSIKEKMARLQRELDEATS